jgi:molecular chaperone DnaK (HSP70)
VWAGGEDFDQRMMDYVISQFKRKHKIDVSQVRPFDISRLG